MQPRLGVIIRIMMRNLLAGILALAGLIIAGLTFIPIQYQDSSIRLPDGSKESSSSSLSNREVQLHLSNDLVTGEQVMLEMSLLPGGATSPGKDYLEARLDLPGVEVFPDQTVSAPVLVEQPVSFRWLITAGNEDPLPGRLWLTLVSTDAGGKEVRVPALAHPLEIGLRRVAGLPVPEARWLGFGLAGIGAVLALMFNRNRFRPAQHKGKTVRSHPSPVR
jgi:hypothetical protein